MYLCMYVCMYSCLKQLIDSQIQQKYQINQTRLVESVNSSFSLKLLIEISLKINLTFSFFTCTNLKGNGNKFDGKV